MTISACYGAGTRAYTGEGLVGLSWAFLRAGAHNVVAALWEVDDASTPQLMGAMYRKLREGAPPPTRCVSQSSKCCILIASTTTLFTGEHPYVYSAAKNEN